MHIKNVSKSYKNKIILDSASYDFEKSHINVLLGAKGTGKTTLSRCLCKREEFDSGKYSSKLTTLFVSPNCDYKTNLTGKELVSLVVKSTESQIGKAREKRIGIEELLQISNLNSEVYKNISLDKMTYDDRLKIYAVIGCLNKYDLIVIDELMDECCRDTLISVKTLFGLIKQDTIIIFTGTDERKAEYVGEKFAVIDNGKILVKEKQDIEIFESDQDMEDTNE